MPAVQDLPLPQLYIWKILMIDRYSREISYLRLSVTELCNLRCRYCMPEEGICKKAHTDMLTEDEMITAVECGAILGVNKLRITGGEPLVKKNILSIVERSAHVPGIKEVCMTTNGVLLPEYAGDLKAAGLSRLNISLDTLNAEKFRYITRVGDLDRVITGIEAAEAAGFTNTKINVVLIGGFNDDEICDMAELTRNLKVNVRFIELMPMGDDTSAFGPSAYIPSQRVLELLPELIPVPSPTGDVAKRYRFPDGKGHIGLITPVSNHFCSTCNRIRLTSDGKLKPCLHSSTEYSIKGLPKEEMLEVMRNAIWSKPEKHDPLSHSCRSGAGRDMNQIGG